VTEVGGSDNFVIFSSGYNLFTALSYENGDTEDDGIFAKKIKGQWRRRQRRNPSLNGRLYERRGKKCGVCHESVLRRNPLEAV
jgi:hypothetical protein